MLEMQVVVLEGVSNSRERNYKAIKAEGKSILRENGSGIQLLSFYKESLKY